jgi:hypothetical protein
MRIRGKLDTSKLRRRFEKVKRTVPMTLGGEVKRAARIVAVQLAHTAQPFGLDDRAKQLGENATASDIRRCYATPSDVYSAFNDKRMAKAFYARLKKGELAAAQRIVDEHCAQFKGVPIGAFDLFLHQGRRNKRGRIPAKQKPLQIVINPKAMHDYIAVEKKLVGWGKAGWGNCALILGRDGDVSVATPTRGLKRWVTRHVSAPASIVDGTRSGSEKPYVILVNGVGYAALILTASDKAEAVRIGLERYLADKRVTTLVRDALRKELTT